MNKQEAQIIRAEDAQRLLDNPMFTDAFVTTRQAIMNGWAALDTKDKETAAELLLMVKCLDKVQRVIEEHIRTGKIAAKELEGQRKSLLKKVFTGS